MIPYAKHSSAALLAAILFATGSMMARPQPQDSPARATVITHVDVDRTGQQTVVRVDGSGRLAFRTERLNNPERLVLDFDGGRFVLAPSRASKALRPVRGVRVGQFKPDVARVVIDLEGPAPYSIKSDAQSISVLFAPSSAPPAIGASASPASPELGTTTTRALSPKAPAQRPKTRIVPSATDAMSLQSPIQEASADQNHAAPLRAVDQLPDAIQNGMLTFHAQNEPLQSVLDRIGAQANVAIIVAGGLGSEQISVEFRHFRVDEALRQILKGYDALFFYGGEKEPGRPAALKTVWVYPANQGPGMNHSSLETWTANANKLKQSVADPDTDPEARARAVDSLIRREGRQSSGVVLDALKDPSEKVRSQALSRALFMGVEIPEDTLIGLTLDDESSNVRFLALQALPLDPTLRWVTERALHDSSQPVSNAARDILREFDTADAGPASTSDPLKPQAQ